MPNANIDYVTSHQGQAHITTQNVIDLLAGISGDISGIKKFPQLYDGLANEITEALTIQVKTGAALAGGSFFILEDPFDWLLDAGAVGYSRIDILYLVMYEDPETNVQSCDFVYQVGDLYPNGTTGTVPSAPTGTSIVATYPFLRMDMTDGSIVIVTEYAESYLSNSLLSNQVEANTEDIAQMKVDFQAGVDAVYNACVAQGVTPSASTPTAIAAAIGSVAINKFNAGIEQGHSDKKSTQLKVVLDSWNNISFSDFGASIYYGNTEIGRAGNAGIYPPGYSHEQTTNLNIKVGYDTGISRG